MALREVVAFTKIKSFHANIPKTCLSSWMFQGGLVYKHDPFIPTNTFKFILLIRVLNCAFGIETDCWRAANFCVNIVKFSRQNFTCQFKCPYLPRIRSYLNSRLIFMLMIFCIFRVFQDVLIFAKSWQVCARNLRSKFKGPYMPKIGSYKTSELILVCLIFYTYFRFSFV